MINRAVESMRINTITIFMVCCLCLQAKSLAAAVNDTLQDSDNSTMIPISTSTRSPNSTNMISTTAITLSTTEESPMNGEPEVVCAPDAIFIGFYAPIPFEGVVFMSGHPFNTTDNCVHVTSQINHVSILVPILDCALSRQRVSGPVPGVNVTGSLIVSFHPQAIRTALDRVIELNCFFASRPSVPVPNTDLGIIQYPTQPTPTTFNGNVNCFYQVLSAYNISSVQSASVGDAVVHRWVCMHSAISPSDHCVHARHCHMLVPNTTLKHTLIDANGCAADPRIIQTRIRHDSKQLLAQITLNLFAFFNQPELTFTCEVSIERKQSTSCDLDLRCDTNRDHTSISRTIHSQTLQSTVIRVRDNERVQTLPKHTQLDVDLARVQDNYNPNNDLVCMSTGSYIFLLVMTGLVTALAPIIGCGVFCVFKKLYT